MRLHERLTERFVDRRTSVLMRRLRENTMLETEIGKTGEVVVEGHVIGRLDGFMFAADASAGGSEAKALQRRRAEGAGGRDRRARRTLVAGARRSVRARRPTAAVALDRRRGRQARCRRGRACVRALRIIADEHLTGAPRELGAGPARPLAQDPYREAARRRCSRSPRRGRDRDGARRRLPAGRSARRARTAEGRGGGQGPGPARARDACANTACASAPITSICRRCSSRRRARWRRSYGRSSTASPRAKGSTNCAARRQRPDLDPGRQGDRRRRSIARSAIGSAASARCASTFSSGSPI